jgi:hypothetical protein
MPTVRVQPAVEYDYALPVTPKKFDTATSMGFQIVNTYLVRESETIDGAMQIELLTDGEPIVWIGPAEDRQDGWLHIAMQVCDQEPDIPNN